MSSTIPTPSTAVVAGLLDQADLEKGRVGLAIIDNPIKPGKTYIVFDAVAGNNNLHLDTGGSTTYSINKGDGTVDDSHTDTGGIKVLNYVVTGRYIITIDGDFAGIDTSQTVNQSELNKYIEIYAGSNNPVALVVDAFKNCIKLQNVTFTELTTIGDTAFSGCTLLINATLPKATSIGVDAFLNCPLVTILVDDILALMQNKVGVNTYFPTEKFSVNEGKISIMRSGTNRTAWWYNSSTGFAVLETTNGVNFKIGTFNYPDAVTIRDTTGNVGIDNLSPPQKLSVNGDISCEDIILEDVDAINVDAAGNVEGQTISENGTLLTDKYAQLGDAVDFNTIKENGTLLTNKYEAKQSTTSGLSIEATANPGVPIGSGSFKRLGSIVLVTFKFTNNTSSGFINDCTITGTVPSGYRPAVQSGIRNEIAHIKSELGEEITLSISSTGVVTATGTADLNKTSTYTISYTI
jgi:hypothetical protein